MWMVRCQGGDNVEDFIGRQLVGIGWGETGSLEKFKSRDNVLRGVHEKWPEYKPMKAVMTASQLDKIANAMKPGDRVLTYDPSKRIYWVGEIAGGYAYVPNGEPSLVHQRKVRWEKQIARDSLSVPTKNSLGSTLTIFTVPEKAEREIQAVLAGSHDTANQPEKFANDEADIDVPNLLDDLKSKATEFIKDKLVRLDWEQMQQLVAGLLRAMGYKTQVSPQGSDRGKDIVASPDGLGLEQPRIVVEVKHRPGQAMRSQEIRSYLGGRHKDDRGLYVSTGGFSKDAKYEADRASIPLTLMDIDDLVQSVVEYYEQMDLSARSLLPLTKIYWPT